MRKLAVWLVGATLFSLSFAQSSRQSTLVFGLDSGDLITLDPGVCYEFACNLIASNLYETLVQFEGTDLAEVKPGWPKVGNSSRAKRAQT